MEKWVSPPSPESGPLAIELHLDAVSELDQPSPLNILHPPATQRTSPRLSPAVRSEHRHHKSKPLPEVLHAQRRSPRFAPPVPEPRVNSLKRKGADRSVSLSDKVPQRSSRLGFDNVSPETGNVDSNGGALYIDSKKHRRSSCSVADVSSLRPRNGNLPIIMDTPRRSPRLTLSAAGSIRRSPRLSPDQFVVSTMTKFNLGSTNGRILRSSPRFHSVLVGDLKVITNSNVTKESNKATSKNNKLPSESNRKKLDENVRMQCSNIPLIKGEVDEETVEKRLPTDTEVIDPLKCESSEQEKQPPEETKVSKLSTKSPSVIISFIGDPICEEEARRKWQWRYDMKSKKSAGRNKSPESDDDEDKIVTDVQCHYRQAEVRGCTYNLGDCATIRGEGGQMHVGRILEFFRTNCGEDYFRVQWFYRAEDTVLQDQAPFLDKRRLFYSTIENDNPLDCIIAKVKITRVTPKFGVKSYSAPSSDFYFDMEYCLEYSTFRVVLSDTYLQDKISSPPSWVEPLPAPASMPSIDNGTSCATHKAELTLLDLYSGCGGMSTGLNLGAKVSSVNIVTKWSLDYSEAACQSLKLNHPETQVRNEAAEDFLQLLKEWEKLYKRYTVTNLGRTRPVRSKNEEAQNSDHSTEEAEVPRDEFEVSRLVDICYGDPNETGKRGLKFKVRWVGYGPKDDTWEPIEVLSKCKEKIQDFVRIGLKSKILPLPGDVDVICGGPPCQGISGYNRFRNIGSPLDDDRNRQIVVFMDIVQFLKPKFVLMENVTDILRFDKASLARYALGRLVHMGYQARLGTIAAGSYGLPQFRLRVFLWGAQPNEILPQFPLPTHDVIVRYWPPLEFERNTVAYYEGHLRDLEKAAVLRDAISDLPAVTNDDNREEMSYDKPPETELQRFLRSSKFEMIGSTLNGRREIPCLLYDHRPRSFSEDCYLRICQVPKRKGANFRDFPGVVVGADNVARPDQTQEPALLPSGKPLVPHFVYTYEQGKSKRCYGRLWWDETMPTVLTSPNCNNQVAIHPEQDRVVTIRECARLQGFPDYYRFCGSITERYRQIGNAVAVPVSRALGYSLGMAVQKLVSGNGPNMILPPKFSYSTCTQLTNPPSSAENQLAIFQSSTDNCAPST